MTSLFSSPGKQGQQAAQASEGISAEEMQQLQNYINTTNQNLRSTIGGGGSGTGDGFVSYGNGGQSINSTGSAPAAKPTTFAPQAPPSQAGIVPAGSNTRRTT